MTSTSIDIEPIVMKLFLVNRHSIQVCPWIKVNLFVKLMTFEVYFNELELKPINYFESYLIKYSFTTEIFQGPV